ncbi:hypothetical protein ACHAQH_009755 [Verticillium albo-atrum]
MFNSDDNDGYGNVKDFQQVFKPFKDRYREKFKSLDELQGVASSLSSRCINKYITQTAAGMLQSDIKKYDELVSDDYDKKFRVYAKSIRISVPYQIDAYMATAKDKSFFRCEETNTQICYSKCTHAECLKYCNKDPKCEGRRIVTTTVTCPTMLKDSGTLTGDVPKITYVCTDENAFYKDIQEQSSVPKDWIKWGRRRVKIHAGCWQAPDAVSCAENSDIFWTDYPLPADKITIPNPKSVVSDWHKSYEGLRAELVVAVAFANEDLVDYADLADAASIPALMLQAAVDQMASIIEKAEDILEQERKTMIASFLMGLLMLIPMAGTAAGAAGLAGLRSILAIAGAGAEIGVLMYEVVEDPDSALSTVFSFLLGGSASRQPFKEAARARRSMSSAELNKLGPIKSGLQKIDDIRAPVCRL